MTNKLLSVGVVGLVALMAASASAQRGERVCNPQTISQYVDAQKAKVRAVCYDPHQDTLPSLVTVKAHARYDAKGAMQSVAVTATNAPQAAACAAGQVRGWNVGCGPGELDLAFEWGVVRR